MLTRMLFIATLFALSAPAIAQDNILVWSGGIGIDERATVADQTQGGAIDVSSNNQEFAYMFKGQ